ncbi:MAG: hypothetical protein KGJ62_15000 [Armatimonadetes bacterium]|nr:hypothetical protein [Armatimonadota bacterium]MDE2206155.1 hypothetical protein [Armatimonadota bacterium]
MRHVAGCEFCQHEYREINKLLALGAENRLRESIAAGPEKIFSIIRTTGRGERRRERTRRLGQALGYGVLLVAAGGTAALLAIHTFRAQAPVLPETSLLPSQPSVSPLVTRALYHAEPAAQTGRGMSVTPGLSLFAASPSGTAILTTQPELIATAPKKAPLLFVLETLRGQHWEVVLRTTSVSHTFKVATPLARGVTYRWYVRAANGQRSSDATFLVLDSAAASRVQEARAEEAASSLQMALLYTYYGLADDAIAATEHPGLDPTAARNVVAYVRRHFHTNLPPAPQPQDEPAGIGQAQQPPHDTTVPPTGQPTH